MTRPFIVGIGGTAAPGSSTETALSIALGAARDRGAETRLFGSADLAALPLYQTRPFAECPGAVDMIEAVRKADGLIIASPGYHGSISGLEKRTRLS